MDKSMMITPRMVPVLIDVSNYEIKLFELAKKISRASDLPLMEVRSRLAEQVRQMEIDTQLSRFSFLKMIETGAYSRARKIRREHRKNDIKLAR